ncbi:MAG: hypothetical protein AB8B86_13785 [Pseudomonadales bacterium]
MSPAFKEFLQRNTLPEHYLNTARTWLNPVAHSLDETRDRNRCLVVGVSGCQGSGKSTVADYFQTFLSERMQLRVSVLSIDDFYLPLEKRLQLAREQHKLFEVRGVPGTHDCTLLADILDQLTSRNTRSVPVPLFSKRDDDRKPESDWLKVETPVDVLILEGWCVGLTPQLPSALAIAANDLEEFEDPTARWRTTVNNALAEEYQTVFKRIDSLIYLAAPSFSSVYNWRLEQEQKLRIREGYGGKGQMDEAQIGRFIKFYQRLTEHGLATLPEQANHLFELNDQREIVSYSTKK